MWSEPFRTVNLPKNLEVWHCKGQRIYIIKLHVVQKSHKYEKSHQAEDVDDNWLISLRLFSNLFENCFTIIIPIVSKSIPLFILFCYIQPFSQLISDKDGAKNQVLVDISIQSSRQSSHSHWFVKRKPHFKYIVNTEYADSNVWRWSLSPRTFQMN